MAEKNQLDIDDLKAPLLAAVGAADLALERVNEIVATLRERAGDARSDAETGLVGSGTITVPEGETVSGACAAGLAALSGLPWSLFGLASTEPVMSSAGCVRLLDGKLKVSCAQDFFVVFG